MVILTQIGQGIPQTEDLPQATSCLSGGILLHGGVRSKRWWLYQVLKQSSIREMAKGLCELLWLRSLLTEIGFAPSSEMDRFCDNKAAIAIAHNPIQHDCTKHVEIDRHFIKENIEAKIIRFPFVKSEPISKHSYKSHIK
jgi:hypothetical protein